MVGGGMRQAGVVAAAALHAPRLAAVMNAKSSAAIRFIVRLYP
jgi:hypothetical protein